MKKKTSAKKTALRKYKQFHGSKAKKVTSIEFKTPKALVFMGKAVAIEYESDKVLPGKPKRKRLYRHKFGRNVKVYCDPKGKTILLCGGKMKVTDWIRN